MADASSVPTGMALPDTSAQQQTAASGVSLLDHLREQQIASNAQVTGLMHAAATSVPVSAPTPPELAIGQQPRFQPQPLNKSEVVGHGNAKRQGIANTIVAASNLVGAIQQKDKDEKNRRLAVDIEHIYGAVDGMQEAQATLQQDPNNAQAKQVLQKNQQLLDSILSDPKKRKQVAAAFDISFTDPSKNDKPEHQAMAMATKSYGQQLQDKLPTRLAPNAQAQEQLKVAMEQNRQLGEQVNQASKIEELKTVTDIKQQQADEKGIHDKATEDFNRQRLAQQKQQKELDRKEKYYAVNKIANTHVKTALLSASAHLAGIDKQVDGRLAAIDKVNASPKISAMVFEKNLKDYNQMLNAIPQRLNQLEQLHKQKTLNDDDYNKAVAATKAMQDQLQDKVAETQGQLDLVSSLQEEVTEDGEGGKPDGNSKPNGGSSNSTKLGKEVPTSSSSKPTVVQAPTAGDSDSTHY